MSRKDPQYRSGQQLKKHKPREFIEELARKQEAPRCSMPNILRERKVFFETDTTRGITTALEETVPPERIFAAMGVPSGHIQYLFDIAGTVSEDLLRIVRRWPQAFENREVLDAALSSLRSGGYRRLFRLPLM
jgi:hypothetical protein